MTKGKTPAVFLEQASYRQRRLRDAGLLIPVLGLVLWLIPLLWGRDPDQAANQSSDMIYIFGVWVLLIVLAALIARLITPATDPSAPSDDQT